MTRRDIVLVLVTVAVTSGGWALAIAGHGVWVAGAALLVVLFAACYMYLALPFIIAEKLSDSLHEKRSR